MFYSVEKPLDNGYKLSNNKELLDVGLIQQFLSNCYWSKNIPLEYVERFIKFSYCYGIYDKNTKLVGFARAITDYTTFSYVCDVFVLPGHRDIGLATKLIEALLDDPNLQGLKTWMLRTTKEGESLYERLGFKQVASSQHDMEINDLDIYTHRDFINLHKTEYCERK